MEQANLEAKEVIELAHPLGVSPCEVIVNRNDVHAIAGNAVEIACERGDKRLALARLHLGNGAAMQRNAANNLHVKVAHSEHSIGCLASAGESLGEEVIKRLAVGMPFPKPYGLPRKFLIIHLRKRIAKR